MRGSGISPNSSSPKFFIMGALENWKLCSLGVTLYVTTFELIWVLINISRKPSEQVALLAYP